MGLRWAPGSDGPFVSVICHLGFGQLLHLPVRAFPKGENGSHRELRMPSGQDLKGQDMAVDGTPTIRLLVAGGVVCLALSLRSLGMECHGP